MTATMHPPVMMASVYSRALDQQTDLIAMLRRPAIHRAMLDSVAEAHGAERGRRLLDLTHASVAQSEAGYVARSVCRLLAQTSIDIPDVPLEPEQLLTPNGFLLLEEPFRLPAEDLSRVTPGAPAVGAVRCVSWFEFGPDERASVAPRGGIFVCAWAEIASGVLAPLNANWIYGEPWSVSAASRRTPEEIGNSTAVFRWLAALNAFCEQRLVTSSRAPAERATRRRVERAGREPSDVLVVELRRSDQRHHEPSEGEREWSCSWTVTGHWRRQWYESRQTHQAIWISPYVKGDPDKPLRPRRRVFAIVH